MLKALLFHIAIFFALIASGQETSPDTIQIREVIINGISSLSMTGNKTVRIDSAVLKDYTHNNISEVLADNTSIFIKNYGSGGIATISLRGTGAGYTQLAWNGVNLNSPMLGQTDLSLIPSGFIDEINVFYGGSSLFLNSGGIGGIINIENKPVWKKGTELLANLSAGSFGRYSSFLRLKTGNKNFQSSTKVLIQSFENNFSYKNDYLPGSAGYEKREHAAVVQNSLMQEFYLRGDRNFLSARIWYQKTGRDIPVPIVNQQPDPGENQKDEFIRTMINYSSFGGKTDYNTSLSWFSEKLDYQNPLLLINSKNRINTIAVKSGLSSDMKGNVRITLILNDEISIVNSVNYEGLKSRNLASLTASFRKALGEKTGVTALIQQTVKDSYFLVPDFAAGLDYRLQNDRKNFLKVNFSHNSRVPTLNDLYWNPGGNKSLKNESGFTGEITYETDEQISETLSFISGVSLYGILIDNMIKWVPGESGYWSPSNITKANSSGIECSLSMNYLNNFLKIRASAKYAWNNAHIVKNVPGDATPGKQIVYTPEHLFNAVLRTEYKNYYLSWAASYTGKRYTNADNTDWLPGYILNNLSTGLKLVSGRNSVDINLKADNLFNTSYQVIAWYPMPGRSFMVALIYQFAR